MRRSFFSWKHTELTAVIVTASIHPSIVCNIEANKRHMRCILVTAAMTEWLTRFSIRQNAIKQNNEFKLVSFILERYSCITNFLMVSVFSNSP